MNESLIITIASFLYTGARARFYSRKFFPTTAKRKGIPFWKGMAPKECRLKHRNTEIYLSKNEGTNKKNTHTQHKKICCWWGWLSLCNVFYRFATTFLSIGFIFSVFLLAAAAFLFTFFMSQHQCTPQSLLFLRERKERRRKKMETWRKRRREKEEEMFHTTLFNNKCLHIFHL